MEPPPAIDSHPRLSEEAGANIAKFYAQLRSKEVDNKTLPVTARTLETLIRLSSAHAKVGGAAPVTHNLPTRVVPASCLHVWLYLATFAYPAFVCTAHLTPLNTPPLLSAS